MMCNAYASSVEAAWRKYRKQGVQFVGIGVFGKGDVRAAVKTYVDRHKLTYPVLVGTRETALKRLSIGGTPTYMVLDAHGKVVYHRYGFDEPTLKKAIQVALATR